MVDGSALALNFECSARRTFLHIGKVAQMDKVNTLLGFLVALSLATERIVEIIKGAPPFSLWLAAERKTPWVEQARQASIHVLAILVGTILASQTLAQFSTAFGQPVSGWWVPFVLGAMASGGSGIWNSAWTRPGRLASRNSLLPNSSSRTRRSYNWLRAELRLAC